MSIDFVSANGEKTKPLDLSKGIRIPQPTELTKQLVNVSKEGYKDQLKEQGE